MFRPNETANDLFRRLHNRAFDLRVRPDRVEQLMFGTAVEVQMKAMEMSEFILGTSVNFATQFVDGILFHFSTGGNLFSSLLQSQVNLSSTSLYRMHCDGRVKAVVVPSLLHLLAALELIKSSLSGEKVLMLFEGLSPLFLMHKGKESTGVQDSLAANAFKCLQDLVNSQLVILLWANSTTSKQHPGLRDGGSAGNRDPIYALWKQHATKLLHYSVT